MERIVKELQEKMEGIEMAYLQGYDNGPVVGMRAVKSVFVGDIFWLIAGDITSDGQPLMTVKDVDKADVNSLSVALSAQAIIRGSIINITLGTHKVITRTPVNEEKGIVILA